MKKLHILKLPSWYSSSSAPAGGLFVCNQAQILKENGLSVNVLANVEIAITSHKIKYFTYPYQAFVSKENNLTVFRNYFRNLPKLQKWNDKRWIKSTFKLFEKYQKIFGKPDLIHAHSAIWGGYAAYMIKEKYDIPYIITEHHSIMSNLCDYSKNSFEEWKTPYYKKAYSNADYIIPVSDLIQPKIETYLTKKVPIRPISNVLDTDYFYYKKRKNIEKTKFVACNGFYFQKGYDILIPAFDAACDKNPNIEITIVGENFEQKEFRNTLWKNVKNKDKFYFTGELTAEGVRSELWQANVFIIPSRAESQSVATLEALSTGLPIIATSTIPKIMTTPQNSLVVPVENIEAMTNAILKMSEMFTEYDGNVISEHIKQICGKDAFAKAIMEIYEQVINKQ